MLLCPMAIEAKKEKEIFRPLDSTFPALARVDKLIEHWLGSNPLNKGAELVLEKKSHTGDGYGVGAVWGVWTTTTYRTKNGTGITKTKQLFEVKSIIPNQQIVLEVIIDETTRNKSCFASNPPNRPTTIHLTTIDKEKSTEVTAEMKGTLPSFFEAMPCGLLMIPCLWPHWILFLVTLTLCNPCCQVCMRNSAEQNLRNQCDQGLTALKVICEKGPEDQVMRDNGAALNGPLLAAAPPSYGSVTEGNVFCPKCGNLYSNADPFCGKCGARRDF